MIDRISPILSSVHADESLVSRTPCYKVLNGPDKTKLVLALLCSSDDHLRTVTFSIEDGDSFDPIDVAIEGISRDDDAGDIWMIEGRLTVSTRANGAACTICFNTRSRSGTLRFSTPD